MIALIQRVTRANVSVDNQVIGAIEGGLLALIGVQRGDTNEEARRLIQRVMGYRVFSNQQGRMDLSLAQTGGGLLLVPQFTLAADTKKGTKASFSKAAEPEVGQALFDVAVEYARAVCPNVETGRFGADMQVALVNDGPVTFWLQCGP